MTMNIQNLKAVYESKFGAPAEFAVRAPGRVNLIGEHTDYNDGYVFPCALDFNVTILGSPRNDNTVRAYSVTFDEMCEFSLNNLSVRDKAWCNYVKGVGYVLQPEGYHLKGMDILIAGNVPLGSGLSSSAAMEVASCLAYETAGGFDIDPVKRALIGQRAEREYVGVQCGIMDQFISSLGRKSHALFIDTRTLGYEAVPLPESGVSIVIGNTNKPRQLVGSEYNDRRNECYRARDVIRKDLPRVKELRDVTSEELERYAPQMDEKAYKRARHVISEDERVLESISALKSGDVKRFGELMNQSHDSLRDDYKVSCRELDVMVEAARKVKGTLGSRMTGAGFGGCTVSLVKDESVERFQKEVGEEYVKLTNLKPDFFVCKASDGARRIF